MIAETLFFVCFLFLSVVRIELPTIFQFTDSFLCLLYSTINSIQWTFKFKLLYFPLLKFRLVLLYIFYYFAKSFYFFAEAFDFFLYCCLKHILTARWSSMMVALKLLSSNCNMAIILMLASIICWLSFFFFFIQLEIFLIWGLMSNFQLKFEQRVCVGKFWILFKVGWLCLTLL